MTTYARISGGIVAELFTPPDGAAITDCFHGEIASTFVPVPAGVAVEPGWTYSGTTFAAPVVVAIPQVLSANGRQLRYALNASGQRAAWEQAVTATAKADDRDYWQTLGSADFAPQTNPKLARLAVTSGVPLPALFAAAAQL